jgi:hypothetical protein
MIFYKTLKIKAITKPDFLSFGIRYHNFLNKLITILHLWSALLLLLTTLFIYQLYINTATQISPKNVVKSYYDAIDFKEFEKAYSFINPANGISISQFMLETSLSDGVLNSYAKLDAIEIKIVNSSKDQAIVLAKTKWITPLETIRKDYRHEVKKVGDKWFITPVKLDLDIPPNQFISNSITQFFKHGRRAISTQQTYHDDVLKQPVLEILSATLIQYGKEYTVVGEVQNVDNVPADVVLKATLYDQNNKKLASHNAKFVIKHKLMPKETTSFRVNFEDIAWLKNTDVKPSTFNPNEFTPLNTEGTPITFNIQCAGNVTITDLYTQVAISDMEIKATSISGTLFNYGIQEVTIPELLISYYDANKKLIYVDHFFVRDGVRVQRKQYFDYHLLNLTTLKPILSSLQNCFVNGTPNAAIAKAVVPNRNFKQEEAQLQKIEGKGFSYLKIELNNYIGNPK